MLLSYEWNFPAKRTLDYSPCERECGTSNVGVNSKPERPDSPPPNISYYLPFEGTPIRGDPPSARLPTTSFFAITRLSA